YSTSALTIHAACLTIIKLARRLNLNKSGIKELLDSLRSLLPMNAKLPRTVLGLMQIIGVVNSKKVSYYCRERLSRLITPQQTDCSSTCPLNNLRRPLYIF
ncbi:unnamed protein product, partial [Didymodactylos carnosus]